MPTAPAELKGRKLRTSADQLGQVIREQVHSLAIQKQPRAKLGELPKN